MSYPVQHHHLIIFIVQWESRFNCFLKLLLLFIESIDSKIKWKIRYTKVVEIQVKNNMEMCTKVGTMSMDFVLNYYYIIVDN